MTWPEPTDADLGCTCLDGLDGPPRALGRYIVDENPGGWTRVATR